MEPSRGRSILGEVRNRDNAEVFVPRREIPRTPPRALCQPLTLSAAGRDEEGESCLRNSAKASKVDGGSCENVPPAANNGGSPSNQRTVQALCFTPGKKLARSPPPPHTTDGPPLTTFEIPRTPLVSNPAQPKLAQQLSGIESGSSRIQPGAAEKEPTKPSPHSPSITITNRAGVTLGLPEGLVCTENDQAFLQQKEREQEHSQLQRQLVGLDKALRTASEEKEQLQHEAEKIETDLRKMKEKYAATASTVHSIQMSSDYTNSAHSTGGELGHAHLSWLRQTRKVMEVELEKTERELQRKLGQVCRERDSLERRREEESLRLEELSKDLENIQLERREWEERVRKTLESRQAMERELESVQTQLTASRPVSTTQSGRESSTAKSGRESSTTQSGREGSTAKSGREGSTAKSGRESSTAKSGRESSTTQSGREGSTGRESSTAAERAAAEQRLRNLIRRCDLYVQRHHLLKQLRQQL